MDETHVELIVSVLGSHAVFLDRCEDVSVLQTRVLKQVSGQQADILSIPMKADKLMGCEFSDVPVLNIWHFTQRWNVHYHLCTDWILSINLLSSWKIAQRDSSQTGLIWSVWVGTTIFQPAYRVCWPVVCGEPILWLSGLIELLKAFRMLVVHFSELENACPYAVEWKGAHRNQVMSGTWMDKIPDPPLRNL